MKIIKTAALALAMALSALMPVHAASETGSHGWSRQTLTLRNGPGAAYDVTGTVPGEVAIRILRCQVNWCVVDGPGGRGWTSRELVSFALSPDSPLFDVNPNHAAGGPGTICFYQGTNYTGASLCAGAGQVFNDLALYGFDNTFSSVQVTGNVSAAACRDRKFQSYCERIVESQPVLNRFLSNGLSSIRVY